MPRPRRNLDEVLAIDIGGTKLAAAVVDANGRIDSQSRVATPHGASVDAESIWSTLTGLVDRVLEGRNREAIVGIGVGCGGPMEWPAGVVSPLNMEFWRAFPLRERLQKLFPGLPVRVHNDAVCVAVGEHWRGAGRGVDDLLGMVVSTGVGGGLILGGRVFEGPSGNAGHMGHVVVDPEGPPCGCGGRGCLEAIARGPAITEWAVTRGWHPHRGIANGEALALDARRGHPVALAAMRRAGNALGVAIASAIHVCDLQVIAIGGGLSQSGAVLFEPLDEALRAHARMPFAAAARVVPAELGQASGLVGAAALVLGGDRYWSGD